MEISDGWARIQTDFGDRSSDAPVQATYLDFTNGKEIKTALLQDSESIYTTRSFKINDGLELQDETEVIAGYLCKKAKTVINTNTIEIWYTTQLGAIGSVQPGVGVPDGVMLKVLEMVIPLLLLVSRALNHKTNLKPELKEMN